MEGTGSRGETEETVGTHKEFSGFIFFLSYLGFPRCIFFWGGGGGLGQLGRGLGMFLCGCDRCNLTSGSIKTSKQCEAREIYLR